MPSFKIDPNLIRDERVVLSLDDSHHLLRVLRGVEGEGVHLHDGAVRRFRGLLRIEGKIALVEQIHELANAHAPYPIRLCQALLKKDKLDWIIQKACELNIEAVFLFPAKFSVRQALSAQQIKRLNTIQIEACKQSERVQPMFIELGEPPATAVTHLVCDELVVGPLLKDVDLASTSEPIHLWIGPEGGWSAEERQNFIVKNFLRVGLGPLTMRAETASLFALAQIITKL